MAGAWVTDVVEIAVFGECVRIILASDDKPIVLRVSRHTLVKGMALGQKALASAATAEIVPLPPPEH